MNLSTPETILSQARESEKVQRLSRKGVGPSGSYVSDFGNLSIVPNRFSRSRDAYVIDPDLVQLATLRPMQSTELAKTGDATKHLILMEAGLQVDQQKGLGVVADLSTS